MDLGKAIRNARIQKGMSQVAVAKQIGTAPAYISQIESNAKSPSFPMIEQICSALGITLAELFADDLAASQGPTPPALKEPPQQERLTSTEGIEGTVEFIAGEEFGRLVGIDYEALQQLIEEAMKKEFDKRNKG